MRKRGFAVCLAALVLVCGCSSCGRSDAEEEQVVTAVHSAFHPEELLPGETDAQKMTTAQDATKEIATTDKIIRFVDAYGEEYRAIVDPSIASNPYTLEKFQLGKNGIMTYDDDTYTSRAGVDVSSHQGTIDWASVKKAGYEFAYIRIGYRGYGIGGELMVDDGFYTNYQNAVQAGFDVGVYFFSQAVNEEEAQEEADFVLKCLSGAALQLPVVYDPENILDDAARTDGLSGEQLTNNASAFCNRIQEAGYEPMIYGNLLWTAYKLDLSQLSRYPVWYADYESTPQTPYHFTTWQYSSEGIVQGIPNTVDLNIQLMKK